MTSPTPVRVAHITNTDRAIRQLILGQLRDLMRAGYDVTAISPRGGEVQFIESTGITHLHVPMNRRFTPFQDLVTLLWLTVLLRRGRFTVVHTHNPKPSLLGQVAARLARVPVVINTLHGFYFHDHMKPRWRRFYILTERLSALCSDVILSQNGEDIQTAIKEGICRPEKIKRLGNGIDLTRFHRSHDYAELRERTRQELGIPLNAPVVGFVGRLVEEKGLLELFAAQRGVREHVPNVHFVFVGMVESDKPDALKPDEVSRYGIEDVCHFTGLRQDMPAMYAVMDVSVLPSHREGFPRALMEASAMQVPVVATDIRGCREAVVPGRNGLLVPLRSVESLANAILSILASPERAAEMGKEGRRLAEERFDERRVCAIVQAEYTRLIKKKRSPHRAR